LKKLHCITARDYYKRTLITAHVIPDELRHASMTHRCIRQPPAIGPEEEPREQGTVTVSDVTCPPRAADDQLVWEAFRLGSEKPYTTHVQ